jgi:hypothetical protein
MSNEVKRQESVNWMVVTGSLMGVAQIVAKTMLWIEAALILNRVYQIITQVLVTMRRG